jgi:hypothetical protein
MTERITVCDCGHPPTPTSGIGTGYARSADDRTSCYDCAAEETRQMFRDATYGDVLYAYVSPDLDLSQPGTRADDIRGISITTWPGHVLGKGFLTVPTYVVGGKVQYATVLIEGRHWHGRYYRNAGDYIGLRLYKNQPTG